MPGLIVDKVGGGNLNIEIESNYQDLKDLKEGNKLVPGKKYKLVNYLHKYLVEGSDTAKLKEEVEISKTPYNYYIHFESGAILPSGTVTTITYLPDSYTGGKKVGDQGTVTAWYSDGAHRISGIPIVVGIKLSYAVDFYSNPYISNKTIKERFLSPLTGTITTTAESATVIGTGTLFTQELEAEQTITFTTDSGTRYNHKIQEIISDTELVVYPEFVAPDHVTTDATIEKTTFGKEIMRPGGIINTEIHNGEDYSLQTANENYAVRYEDIVLTAVSSSKFSPVAESDTYEGDVVYFDFTDTEIVNRGGEVIGQRDGYIYHRENEKLGISINKNWREHRFRRFRFNDKQFNRFKFTKNVYKLDSGTQTYYVGGISNLSFIESKRCALLDVQDGFSLQDYSIVGDEEIDDVFNGEYESKKPSGVENIGPDGERWDHYYDPVNAVSDFAFGFNNEFKAEEVFNLNFHEIQCRDEFIIPLNENRELNKKVKQVKVVNLENTIFRNLNKGQGVSSNIDIVAKEVIDSTFLTGGKIRSINESIIKFCSFEEFDITNSGEINTVINFANLKLRNKGLIGFSHFGGAWSYPINFVGNGSFIVASNCILKGVIVGFGTTNNSPNIFDNTVATDVLIKYYTLANSIFTIKGALTSIANTEDKGYGGNTWFQRSATQNVKFDLLTGFNKLTGDSYLLDKLIRDKHIKTDPITKELYYEKINGSTLEIVSVTKPKRQVNLSSAIISDNAAPNVGEQITLTVTAENIGKNNTATEAVAEIQIPAGFTYSADDAAGSYDSATGIWTIGELASATSQALNITLTADAVGETEFTANVSSNENEINPVDNTASVIITPA